jgi:hypothetical protein
MSVVQTWPIRYNGAGIRQHYFLNYPLGLQILDREELKRLARSCGMAGRQLTEIKGKLAVGLKRGQG